MPGLRHPLSGAVYDITPEGVVRVSTDSSSGLFDPNGVWVEGDLRTCDPQMCNWLASGVHELAGRRPTPYQQEDTHDGS